MIRCPRGRVCLQAAFACLHASLAKANVLHVQAEQQPVKRTAWRLLCRVGIVD